MKTLGLKGSQIVKERNMVVVLIRASFDPMRMIGKDGNLHGQDTCLLILLTSASLRALPGMSLFAGLPGER